MNNVTTKRASQHETTKASLHQLTHQLDQLIAGVLDLKQAQRAVDWEIALWNTQEVADYFKASYRYTSEYIVTNHTFPGAIRLPNKEGKKGHPRWYAREVVEWAAKYQEH